VGAIAFWAWVGLGIVTYFPFTALLVKGLHDTGRSGAWTVFQHLMLFSLLMLVASAARMAAGSLLLWGMVMLICAIGSLVVFIFTLAPGDDGSNSYGLSG